MFRIAAVFMLCCAMSQAATTFDLSADFSYQKNPNGVWQYGYSAGNSLDPAEFRVDTYADPTGPIGFWHPALSKGPGPGWYPYIAHNDRNQTMFGSSNGWAARAGEVAMEGSNTGQYSNRSFCRTDVRNLQDNGPVRGHPLWVIFHRRACP